MRILANRTSQSRLCHFISVVTVRSYKPQCVGYGRRHKLPSAAEMDEWEAEKKCAVAHVISRETDTPRQMDDRAAYRHTRSARGPRRPVPPGGAQRRRIPGGARAAPEVEPPRAQLGRWSPAGVGYRIRAIFQ